MTQPTSTDLWLDHKSQCQQCREHPDQLCRDGYRLLTVAALVEEKEEN